MKRTLLFCSAVFAVCFFAASCAETKSLQKKAENPPQRITAVPHTAADKHLTERVWSLAACRFEGTLQVLDANMSSARIKFAADGTFETANGISYYRGTWKKGVKKGMFYRFSFDVMVRKTEDALNAAGRPFDTVFFQNLKDTGFAEFGSADLKFYSNDKVLLLRFIRL